MLSKVGEGFFVARLEYGFVLRKLNRVLDVGKRGSKDSRMTFDPMIDSTQA